MSGFSNGYTATGMNQPTYKAPTETKKAPETVTKKDWKLRDIANRNEALICVMVDNPKQPGSDARLLFPYQGERGKPTVTVAQYLAIGAEVKGKMGLCGTARVRSDLIYNLNHGFVKLVDRNGNDL